MKTERILRAEEGRTTQSPQGFGARARGALVLRHFGKGKRPESGPPPALSWCLGILVVNPGPAGPFKVSQAHSRLATFHVGDSSSFSPIQGCFGKKLFILSFSSPGALAVSKAFQAVPRLFPEKKDCLYSDDNLRHLPFVRSKKGR
jgi:hypothetical protein